MSPFSRRPRTGWRLWSLKPLPLWQHSILDSSSSNPTYFLHIFHHFIVFLKVTLCYEKSTNNDSFFLTLPLTGWIAFNRLLNISMCPFSQCKMRLTVYTSGKLYRKKCIRIAQYSSFLSISSSLIILRLSLWLCFIIKIMWCTTVLYFLLPAKYSTWANLVAWSWATATNQA